jgi:hypothetical protein
MELEKSNKIYSFTLETISEKTQDIIYLDYEFIITKMNHIFQKLIGVGDHILTTHNPTKNSSGNYTILENLHITRPEITKLLAFLRTGFMAETDFTSVNNTAVILGGFTEVDQFISNFYQRHTHDKTTKQPEPPQIPEQDINHKYQWVTMDVTSLYIQDLVKVGWSATGYLFTTIRCDQQSTCTYYRKPIGE